MAPEPGSAVMSSMSSFGATTTADSTDFATRPSPYPEDEDGRRCRECLSSRLHVDWAQGDRICTDCGVVHEDRVRFYGPEWREFGNDDDVAKRAGQTGVARSGLVATDESRYIGGLQPTQLSRQPYGGAFGPSGGGSSGGTATDASIAYREATIRRRLVSTNRRLDRMMERRHEEQMEEARLARSVMSRRRREAQQRQSRDAEAASLLSSSVPSLVTHHDHTFDEDLGAVGREHLDLVLDEEDAHRLDAKATLSQKWSLHRAILLHGTHDEQPSNGNLFERARDIGEERDELVKKLDRAQRAAAADIYRARQMLLAAARRLQFSERLIDEASSMLCRYGTEKDSLMVRGVSRRAKDEASSEGKAHGRDVNKAIQMGALASALLYLAAKKYAQPRSLKEVCASVRVDAFDCEAAVHMSQVGFIKPKHCSRAMTEIKATFPDYVRSISLGASLPQNGSPLSFANDSASHKKITNAISLVEQSARKLNLSSSAAVAIQHLVSHCLQEQVRVGDNTKTETVCAALTHMVCLAGSNMQKLARQALAKTEEGNKNKRKHIRARPDGGHSRKKHTGASETKFLSGVGDTLPAIKVEAAPFDALSDAPVQEETIMSKAEHKTLFMWDAWCSQKPWARSERDVAGCFWISEAQLNDHYIKKLRPRGKQLLGLLEEAGSNSTEKLLLGRIWCGSLG